ncbi:rhodanese-like domain-containing protein [Lysobacter enzymogenes]|uniref:rhodanese-like domain-containing protein n=1 Tax=Lysobacter enzymogenes TaxID=69 RepID=UPI00374975F0
MDALLHLIENYGLLMVFGGIPPERREEVIVYCDCPSEASAATLARELRRRGFKRVRPLAGGFEA